MCFIASSSLRVQAAHLVSPYDIIPRMILETFKPELPSLTTEESLGRRITRNKGTSTVRHADFSSRHGLET